MKAEGPRNSIVFAVIACTGGVMSPPGPCCVITAPGDHAAIVRASAAGSSAI